MRSTPGWTARRARDLRALVHYRPSQIVRRVALLARRAAASASPGRIRRRVESLRESPPPTQPHGLTDAFLGYALDEETSPPDRARGLVAGEFTFLGETRVLGERPEWNRRGPGAPSHLWRMNLHYHRFLVDAAAGARRRAADQGALFRRAAALLDDWNASCPPAAREAWGDSWNSYAVSTRILNAWTAWLLLDGIGGSDASALRSRLEGLGASSAAFLEGWLERDLGGNHLLRNAAALTAAGRWFRGPDASRWEETGSRLLGRELDAQFLADGFHEERSPMYHALALEELLLSRFSPRAGLDAVSGDLVDRCGRMREALSSVLHPDGRFALFNDSAFGIAASPTALEAWAAASGVPEAPPPGDLPDAGYFRFGDEREVLLFDAGPLGPNHLPAHAHCDALSFEWSVGGRRVVTDTGVDRYEAGADRDFQRSTAAHATLQVEDLEQAECFSSFRMGRRPRVEGSRTGPSSASGRHDGFGRRAVHRRSVEWLGGTGLRWSDEIDAPTERRVRVRVTLAPDVRVSPGPDGARLDVPGVGRLEFGAPGDGTTSVEPGIACERFGRREPRPVLRWDGVAGRGRVLRFSLIRDS